MAALSFKVIRKPEILVGPSLSTPKEILYLSNIDDQPGLRYQVPVVQFYKYCPLKRDEDPAKVIREALGRLLVLYYPFAGRLRDAPNGKLKLECTGEGVLFIEADADVALQDFGELQPPFPCWDELLYDVPGSQSVTNSPLLLIQVTRLRCKGFVFTIRLNHVMSDATGLVQFMTALGEMAQGMSNPSVPPIWERELLRPRSKPAVNLPLYEYDQLEGQIMAVEEMSHNSFFFGPKEISSLKRQAAGNGKSITFEVLSACLWRLRTRALGFSPDQDVRLMFPLDARLKFEPPLPKGYYGDAFSLACAKTKAGLLATKPLPFAVELIQKAKTMVSNEYIRSVIDLMELKGRPHFTVVGTFVISDLTKSEFGNVDLGWGKPVYGGPAKAGVEAMPGLLSFLIPYRNKNGEEGKRVPVCLPSAAMEKFEEEMREAMEHSAPFLPSSL